jgi:hypothetical protein
MPDFDFSDSYRYNVPFRDLQYFSNFLWDGYSAKCLNSRGERELQLEIIMIAEYLGISAIRSPDT